MNFFKKYSQKMSNKNMVLSDVITKEAKKSNSGLKYFFIFSMVGLLIVAVVLFFVLPQATIILTPRTEIIAQEMKVFIDHELNYQANTIPGQPISLSEKFIKRFPATGSESLLLRAQGTITVYNEDKPLILIPSRFETPEGLIFLSKKNVKLPIGATEIEVVAEKPGSEYNIGPTTFVLPAFRELKSSRYTKVYGKSEVSMQGGVDEYKHIISQEDIDKARQELQKEAEDKLRGSLKPGLSLLEPSINSDLVDFSTSLMVGEEAEAFNAILDISLSAIAFSYDDLKNLVSKNLLLKNPDYLEPINESLKVDLLESNSTALRVRAEQEVYRKINKLELGKTLANKNGDETQDYLGSLDNIAASQVTFWPFWVKRMPRNINKINIKINLD